MVIFVGSADKIRSDIYFKKVEGREFVYSLPSWCGHGRFSSGEPLGGQKPMAFVPGMFQQPSHGRMFPPSSHPQVPCGFLHLLVAGQMRYFIATPLPLL
jgi:hypothetical protein